MPQQETYWFLLGFVFAFWTQESFRVPPILQEVQTLVFLLISVYVCGGGIAWGSRVKTRKKSQVFHSCTSDPPRHFLCREGNRILCFVLWSHTSALCSDCVAQASPTPPILFFQTPRWKCPQLIPLLFLTPRELLLLASPHEAVLLLPQWKSSTVTFKPHPSVYV